MQPIIDQTLSEAISYCKKRRVRKDIEKEREKEPSLSVLDEFIIEDNFVLDTKEDIVESDTY
jgi:hypothetical protein